MPTVAAEADTAAAATTDIARRMVFISFSSLPLDRRRIRLAERSIVPG
jgi:hypothetical protein